MAYGFFFGLDKKLSDKAKAALARTMRLKDYKNEDVASALVEVFDRIYTYPLLRWRAFFRSLLFTTVVSAIYAFELRDVFQDVRAQVCALMTTFEPDDAKLFCSNSLNWLVLAAFTWISASLFDVFTDYLSLFVIRPILIRSGTKPVISLALGAVSGAAIVLAANSLREVAFWSMDLFFGPSWSARYVPDIVPTSFSFRTPVFVWPALAVFVWLPLFALGILIARLLTPLSWIVGRTQWLLKDGEEHPLEAIGYVAAVVVFLGTVAARAVFRSTTS